MSEPHSSAVSAVMFAGVSTTAALAIGPLLNQYLLIGIGGFFGSLFALSSQTGLNFFQVLLFLFRSMGSAVLFTSISSLFLASYLRLEVGVLWMPVAGVIAMYAHNLYNAGLDNLKSLSETTQKWIRSKFRSKK